MLLDIAFGTLAKPRKKKEKEVSAESARFSFSARKGILTFSEEAVCSQLEVALSSLARELPDSPPPS